jgi:hypothetical protein
LKWPELRDFGIYEVPVEPLGTQLLFAPGTADLFRVFDPLFDGPLQGFRKEVLQKALAIVDFIKGTLDFLGGCHQLSSPLTLRNQPVVDCQPRNVGVVLCIACHHRKAVDKRGGSD